MYLHNLYRRIKSKMSKLIKMFWVTKRELFVIKIKERSKTGRTWWLGTGYQILTSKTEKAVLCFYLKEKSLQNGKEKNKLSGEKKHKIVGNTSGRLPDLLNAFKSPGPFYILVSTAKIQQSKSYSVCDYSLKNNLWLERQPIEQN